MGYYDQLDKLTKEYAATTRAKKRGLAFVRLYASAKQLVTLYPKRFPYLEQDVLEIEREGLAPPIEKEDRIPF